MSSRRGGVGVEIPVNEKSLDVKQPRKPEFKHNSAIRQKQLLPFHLRNFVQSSHVEVHYP